MHPERLEAARLRDSGSRARLSKNGRVITWSVPFVSHLDRVAHRLLGGKPQRRSRRTQGPSAAPD